MQKGQTGFEFVVILCYYISSINSHVVPSHICVAFSLAVLHCLLSSPYSIFSSVGVGFLHPSSNLSQWFEVVSSECPVSATVMLAMPVTVTCPYL